MPNWCDNTLRIWAPDGVEESRLLEVEELLRDDHSMLSFRKVLPVPPEIDQHEDGMVGYNWRVENWGTKWDAHPEMIELERGHRELIYGFHTAWAPPLPVVAELSRAFQDLVIGLAWDEPGMDFGGYAMFRAGDRSDFLEGGSRSSTWDEMLEMNAEWS
jgi:hypothetical protein